MTAHPLPPLRQLRTVARPLSVPEYYHACVGTHPRTLEDRRTAVLALRSDGRLDPAQLQAALAKIALVNPGLCLRIERKSGLAHWRSDGPKPRLRMIEDCTWDGCSAAGTGFIAAEPLSLEDGPSVELIYAQLRSGGSMLVLRTFHAVVDGGGVLHFFYELFRALRGESPLGSNAEFSDAELMRSLGIRKTLSRHMRTCGLTGSPQGDEVGDEWRRVPLGPARPHLLSLTAQAMAEFAHQYSDLPALIAVPVDLRRHVPGLLSTMNFSNMLLVPLEPGAGAELFRRRLAEMLEGRMEAVFPRWLDLLRWLPMPWLDLMVSRTPDNYRRRRPMETVVISNLGRLDLEALSCPRFRVRQFLPIPLTGSAFAALVTIDGQAELTINLPRVLASEGRFDALVAHLQRRIGRPTQ